MIEKKQKTAVALGFEKGDEAPKILATGKGHIAEKIIREAKENNIPIHYDAKLADTLSKLDFDEYIPPELYEAVIQVLMYVDKVDAVREKLK
ncbi:MAG: EscU/YscU/HrcU family type III secretion system export apparatus switch protein [Lachnospiraceae bacterium]|nr:EscU/YscU/HrcU family type III secretion system export apparatus switch protein [Lachnospiraceae bacterium]